MSNIEIIGNLDSDVSLDEDHFEFLLNKFKDDPCLGVAGTVFSEDGGYSSETDSFEGQNHVSGSVPDVSAPVLRGNWRILRK